MRAAVWWAHCTDTRFDVERMESWDGCGVQWISIWLRSMSFTIRRRICVEESKKLWNMLNKMRSSAEWYQIITGWWGKTENWITFAAFRRDGEHTRASQWGQKRREAKLAIIITRWRCHRLALIVREEKSLWKHELKNYQAEIIVIWVLMADSCILRFHLLLFA